MGVMSRIRGIEAKVQKETAQILESRRNKYTEGGKKKNEISHKVDTERHQISELLYKLPKLNQIFDVHRKIGEGTFSSVYLGSLKQHAQLPEAQKRWFAIKHLVPTAHPARIEHELRCLQDMGGKDYVIGVDLCLRHLDTIVFIMPYIPHRKFSEYVGDMDTEEVRCYMRALLVALRHVHSFGVIHRDVKPSNFLYDRENRRYLLVDFGLAQRVVSSEKPQLAAAPPSPAPPPAHSNHLKRPREEDDTSPSEKRIALDLSTRVRCTNSISPVPRRLALPKVQIPKQNLAKVPSGGCSCSNAGAVCSPCSLRAAARAPRAGTQGFRPPEVLLKSPRQGPGVDMWAAGVVLASLLTARYPFFRAADDASALAELADLLGTRPLQRAAAALGATPPCCARALSGRHSYSCVRRAPHGDVAAPARPVSAQAGGASAREHPHPHRSSERPPRAHLRALPPATPPLPVRERRIKGQRHLPGRAGGGVPGRGLLAGGAVAGARPAPARLRRGRAGSPLPR